MGFHIYVVLRVQTVLPTLHHVHLFFFPFLFYFQFLQWHTFNWFAFCLNGRFTERERRGRMICHPPVCSPNGHTGQSQGDLGPTARTSSGSPTWVPGPKNLKHLLHFPRPWTWRRMISRTAEICTCSCSCMGNWCSKQRTNLSCHGLSPKWSHSNWVRCNIVLYQYKPHFLDG